MEVTIGQMRRILIRSDHEGFLDVIDTENETLYIIEYIENTDYYQLKNKA